MPEANGIDKKPPMPAALQRWNWGAMLLNVFWGAKYNVDLAFLTLIPVFGLVVPFILGYKGNEWAWNNSEWKSVEHFEKTQANWTFWGVVIWFFLVVVLFIPALNAVVNLRWTLSDVYRQTSAEFVKIEKIKKVLGEKIHYRVYEAKSLPGQKVRINIKFSGSLSTVKTRFYAAKIEGKWAVYRITMFDPAEKSPIDFPLPTDIMMYGPAFQKDIASSPSKNYHVLLESAGEVGIRHLAQVITDFNPQLTMDQAVDLVRFAPKRIYSNITYAGAMKIKYKLEDFGAKVEVQEGAGAK